MHAVWMRPALTLLLLSIVLPAPLRAGESSAQQSNGPFANGVVAADHPLASAAGAEILKRGGNVVDAAVATSFALSVVRPASCGIGGGGFMVIWDAEHQKAVALDYRERAPLAASRDMFADTPDGGEAPSRRGCLANGVPGTVAGLCYAAQKYGSLPLSELIAPAIRLAEQGVPLDETDRRNQRAVLARFEEYPAYRQQFAALLSGYLNNGEPWGADDRFHSPQLPALKRIREKGRAGFYGGEVAAAIVRCSQDGGGLITAEDLFRMQPVERPVLRGEFDGNNVLTMPPPSSGGVALLQMLGVLSAWEDRNGRSHKPFGHNSPEYTQLIVEAMKHAFADRAEFLGDTDFADVPMKRLLSAAYADQLARRIRLNTTGDSEEYGRFLGTSDSGTSHFSVIDAAGNAVACTETINLTYGSFVVVPEYGILLNDEMDDFAARPGEPNAFGLMQSEANAVAARKKPLSSMTPTIVVRDGKAVAAMGASGGPRIISATLQVLLNQVRFDMTPAQAVNSPRFHHQWFPHEALLERPLFDTLAPDLRARGHAVKPSSGLAAAQAVARRADGLYGGSDRRKLGRPAGH